MLFDGTLQTWELVALLSLVPWLFVGVFSCISERSPRWGQFLVSFSIAVSAIGMIVGVFAIIVGVAAYASWAGFKEFLLGLLLMVAIIFAYFLAMGFLILLSVVISAIFYPTPDDSIDSDWGYGLPPDEEDYN